MEYPEKRGEKNQEKINPVIPSGKSQK